MQIELTREELRVIEDILFESKNSKNYLIPGRYSEETLAKIIKTREEARLKILHTLVPKKLTNYLHKFFTEE